MLNPNFQSVLLFDKRRKPTFVRIICTLNLVFILLGYPLMTGSMALFMPEALLDSSAITWPLRGLFLAVSILAFLFGNSRNAKLDSSMWLFIIFSILYLLRAFVDLSLRDPGSFSPQFAWKFSEYDPVFRTPPVPYGLPSYRTGEERPESCHSISRFCNFLSA